MPQENHGFTLRKISNQSTMVVTVKVAPELRFRIWLGLLLIRAGVRVTGMGFEYKGITERGGEDDAPPD